MGSDKWILWVSLAGALPQGIAGEIPQDWSSARGLGVGDASGPVLNDETSVFSNPAGVAKARNPRGHDLLEKVIVPGLTVFGDSGGLGALEQGWGVAKPKDWATDELSGVPPQESDPRTAGIQVFPAVILGGPKGVTGLVGLTGRLLAQVWQGSGSGDAVHVSGTWGGVAAVGVTNRSGFLSAGLSVRPNVRYEYETDNLNPLMGNGVLGSLLGGTRTSALALDAGILVTVPDFWLPTFSLSVQNLPLACASGVAHPLTGALGTYCGSVRTGAPPGETSMESRVDVTQLRLGLGLTPRMRLGNTRANLRMSAEVFPVPLSVGSEFYGMDGLSVTRLLHAGAELGFGSVSTPNGVSLRTGIHDGQPTYGVGADLWGLSADVASFSAIVGPGSSAPVQRRYLMQVSFAW